MKKILLIIVFFFFMATTLSAKGDVTIAYFYSDNCLLCEEIAPYIAQLENLSNVTIDSYKIAFSPNDDFSNHTLFRDICYDYGSLHDVPIMFLANEWFYFGNRSALPQTMESLNETIDELRAYDIVSPVQNGRFVYPKPVSALVCYNSSKGETISQLENALEENITYVRVDTLDVSFPSNMSLFGKLHAKETPVVFIGNTSYPFTGNVSQIVEEAKIYEKIGIEFPSAYTQHSVCVTFFYKSTCSSCLEMKSMIEVLARKYPIELSEYDIFDNKNNELLLDYYAHYNITRSRNSNVFIGDSYFYSESQIDEIEREIKQWLITGLDCPEIKDEETTLPTLLVVITGGLIDSINPCAFATLIFFIAYLERSRKEAIVPVGLSFAAGIYVCYFLIGVGLYAFINVISSVISTYLYVAVGVAAVILGLFSIGDFFILKKGGKATLQLPMFLKKRRGRIIKNITGDKKITLLIVIAFSTGLAISALEFACTGQVLIPVITAIQESTRLATAIGYLILYTTIFILPLLVLLYLFHKGSSSEAIGGTYKKIYHYTKLATGIFLIILGFIMLYKVFG